MNRATSATGWARNPDGTLGWTWNPMTGCLNHTPEGLCFGGMFPCYAWKLANGRLKERYIANNNYAPIYSDSKGIATDLSDTLDPFYPRFWENRILEPRDNSRGKGIFVCDMSDLFGLGIPDEWIKRVLKEIPICHDNRFYLLTKQQQNLIKWSPFPENCYVGVTATGHEMFWRALGCLSQLKAEVKYLSIEPFLERIAIAHIPIRASGVRQVIIGAQTKPYRPPEISWVQEIVEACDKAGIPVFLKDNLEPLLEQAQFTYKHTLYWRDGYYTSPDHPNVDLHLRQEMPLDADNK